MAVKTKTKSLKKGSIFEQLDATLGLLRKAYGEEEAGGEDQFRGRPGEDDEQDEQDDGNGYTGEEDEDQDDDGDEDDMGEGEEQGGREEDFRRPAPQMDQAMMGKTFAKTIAQELAKALNTLQFSKPTSKTIVGGKGNEFQDNYKEDDINDESVAGIDKYDDYDDGYGGPNMPPKLMTPKQYEALYNEIVATGKKGPSIKVVTDNAYDSAKSFTGQQDDLVDVTPLMKDFHGKLNGLNATVRGTAALVDKLAQTQIASAKALATMMSKSQGRKSTAALQKSQAAQQQQPQFNPRQVLPLLEKGVASGALSSIELTKFEMTGRMTPDIENFLTTEGGLR